MSVDAINGNPTDPNLIQTTTWKELIQAAEDRVNECQIQIQRLTKSIAFFRKQEDAKIPFPLKAKKKQQDTADLS